MPAAAVDFASLPGGDLVAKGLADIADGATTTESLLVEIGAPRLRSLGLEIPTSPEAEAPEHRLYGLLATIHGDAAHSRYNALVRRLVSFERTLACVNRPTQS